MSGGLFDGRVSVVTGAASGIGLGIAHRFAEEGAAVAMLDINEELGRHAVEQVQTAGGVCDFFPVDVSVESRVMETVARVIRRFSRVDHLVNNAGIVLVRRIEDCTVADWDRVMDVNVKSMFLMTKHLLSPLRRSSNASIVNVGSVSGLVAQQGTPAYVASKGAVLMLSKALALDLASDGVRVNCVCPGITDTPLFRFHIGTTADPDRTLRERCDRVPLGRALLPREIADAVLYLSSRQSSGITGAELIVDAGYTAAAEYSPELSKE